MKKLLALLLATLTLSLAGQSWTKIEMRGGGGSFGGLALAPSLCLWRLFGETNWSTLGTTWQQVGYYTNAPGQSSGGDYFNFRSEQADIVEWSTSAFSVLDVRVTWFLAFDGGGSCSSNYTKSFILSDIPACGSYSNAFSVFHNQFDWDFYNDISITPIEELKVRRTGQSELDEMAEKAFNKFMWKWFGSGPGPQ